LVLQQSRCKLCKNHDQDRDQESARQTVRQGRGPARRVHGKSGQQTNTFTREMKQCLLDAAENVGNRLVAISNAKLPKHPTKKLTEELIKLLRLDPNGMTSYFEWLAEHHPAIFASLLGKALPMILQNEDGSNIEVVYENPDDIERSFVVDNLPVLERVFKLPKRIDLEDPPTIDVTPTDDSNTGS
jgi:hypothetical protein